MAILYQHLYGPVPSRRFGRSLGIDLMPHKACCLDCIFCQLGPTHRKTLTPQNYVSTEQVKNELESWYQKNGKADYIALSGSGEPTLHAAFGEVLATVKAFKQIPTALLSNGALFYREEVRQAASQADVVKISLSAWDQASFEGVNRSHPRLQFHRMLAGQKAFRREFEGELWLEVFLVRGFNSLPEQVRKIAALAREIAPDRIHLNTVTRPPSEGFAMPVTHAHMQPLTELFEPQAEIISEFIPKETPSMEADQESIMAILKRRPCTSRQIADVCGLHFYEVAKHLTALMKANQVRTEPRDGAVYYVDAEREVRQ
jgi:wyosine [tRNA(Phe)-imidazoG37] synthetase (radical SAM superfamily)